jgi:hypothetical protein
MATFSKINRFMRLADLDGTLCQLSWMNGCSCLMADLSMSFLEEKQLGLM